MRLDRAGAALTCALLVAPSAGAEPKLVSTSKLEANCYSPRWAHDGAKFSYEWHDPKKDEKGVTIVTMEGMGREEVVPDTGPDVSGFDDKKPVVRELAWHPEGRAYVYGSTGGRSQLSLYMEGEGCLTCEKVFGYGNKIHPTWSNDGKFLAYAKEANDQGDVFVADIYNLEKGPQQVTESEDDTSYQPRFHPSAAKLMFTRFNPDKSDNDMWVLDNHLDKKTVRKLTKLSGAELNASWSPDGTKVAFFANHKKKDDKKFDLYVAAADGKSAAKRLLKDVIKPDRANPVWTPDGTKLLVVKDNVKKHNPIVWVAVDDPKKTGELPTGTELNDYLALFVKDGKMNLLWTAQGKKKDKKKRWKKVYLDTVTLP